MKGIVLAGGLGTRLYPITKIMNKHILPVGDKPMFYHPLLTLVASGIKEIAVVSGPPFGDQVKRLIKYLPSWRGGRIIYVEQKTAAGMPDAISKCKKFADGDSLIVIAGDNIYGGNFKSEIKSFKTGALSFLREVNDPERFAVPVYDRRGKLKGMIEKPRYPESNWIISGPHLFDRDVFDLITKLKPSARGELEIADLNMLYLNKGLLKLKKRSDYWLDLGTFESLAQGTRFKLEEKK